MQEKYPQKPGLDFILKQAFYYWNRTLLFQVMFSIIYFAVFFTAFFFFLDYYEISSYNAELIDAFRQGQEAYLEQIQKMSTTENVIYFDYAFSGILIFLYPLNLGFFQIYRKIDLKEPISLGDLFAGYNGLNFFRYVSYFLFWFMFFRLTTVTVIVPIFWVMVTLFVAPLMFFQNKTIFEAVSMNWKILKTNFLEMLICVIVAFIFRYIGFALFFVGILFTFPFWNAMIYSLYKTIFKEEN
ncbi:hypothetical protein K0U91_07135 [Chryseobacterium chendengshani]|uniref:hypothetical protein n=1 Tax=Chryseobacterium sp. LJ668 TaxID=2864040 RepID=UPI001C68F5D8|nr:hypothetical protein [Chryseobacterium sp. LJ668]MBW8522242.1 hypothetical protein [Chryseobacterium sp. LJ668]QYK17884.1 hypothetical protein K0U91_07135 [Chryseobacterium sp. LJ668]